MHTRASVQEKRERESEQVHEQVDWEKKRNLKIFGGFQEKPRDGRVGETLIKRQIEKKKNSVMNFYGLLPGYLKTSYFGVATQRPLFSCVRRG